MEKFIAFEKLSKQRQRELNARKRSKWGEISPVTRKSQNLNVYNRKKTQQLKDDTYNAESFILINL